MCGVSQRGREGLLDGQLPDSGKEVQKFCMQAAYCSEFPASNKCRGYIHVYRGHLEHILAVCTMKLSLNLQN
jgi:hypothetical protein